MRWFWIDRYTEFVSGQRATALKCISLAEEQVHDHFPGHPIFPNTLVAEGMAQTAGLLVSEVYHFAELVVLAKVSKVEFFADARPGDTLTYRAVIEQAEPDGAVASVTSYLTGGRRKEEQLQAEMEVFFANLPSGHADTSSQPQLFDPKDLYRWTKVLGVFDVGRRADGFPLEMPPSLAAAERAILNDQ